VFAAPYYWADGDLLLKECAVKLIDLKRLDKNLLVIVLFSVFAWAPLLSPAYFLNAHDARHSIFFLVEFDQTFKEGYLYPRWAADFSFGYGYPLFNMYAPLAFYVAELIHLLGASFSGAIKASYLLSFLAAGGGMYGLTKKLLQNKEAALVAAVLYIFIPFRFIEIYVRSSYAEFAALAFMPFVLWAFIAVLERPSLKRTAIAALAYGSLVMLHHVTFFTLSIFLVHFVIYKLLNPDNKNSFRDRLKPAAMSLAAGAGGILLASVYLVPMVVELPYIKLEQWTGGSYSFIDHFVYFAQFFSSSWGYGYSGPGLADDMSFQLGIAAYALAMMGLVAGLSRDNFRRSVTIPFGCGLLLILFLLLPVSAGIWQTISLASLVQFPWRLLGMIALPLCLLAGRLLADDSSEGHIPTRHAHAELLLLIAVIVLGSVDYARPEFTEIPDWAETPRAVVEWDRFSIKDRVAMVSVTTEQPTTSPLESLYLSGSPLTAGEVIEGHAEARTLYRGGAISKVQIISSQDSRFKFYVWEYPGWKTFLDGREVKHLSLPPYGLIAVDVPAGDHTLELKFTSTSSRTIGGLITGLMLIICMIAVFGEHIKFSGYRIKGKAGS
jgi:hypothetical protein